MAEAMQIRRAALHDVEILSALARRTFTETFGHLYPPDDLKAFLDGAYSADTHRMVLSHPNNAAWLLERDGEAVGHALAGPCSLPHPDVRDGDGELKRLYLLCDVQNGGWGRHLFETTLAWLERDGPRALWIGVWSENIGAQRFYARHGFSKVGEYFFPVGNTRDLEFILHRPPSTM